MNWGISKFNYFNYLKFKFFLNYCNKCKKLKCIAKTRIHKISFKKMLHPQPNTERSTMLTNHSIPQYIDFCIVKNKYLKLIVWCSRFLHWFHLSFKWFAAANVVSGTN